MADKRATSSPLTTVSLYPGEESSIQEYKNAQEELRSALQARQNQLFDPVFLAMAQGFLAPTKSGSFGETLSNVAALVGPAQEAQNKRAIEMAQIRAQLAAQEIEQGRKGQALRMEQDYLKGLPSAQPAEAGAEPPATGGIPGAAVSPINRAQGQNQYGLYPSDLIDRIRRVDPDRAKVMDDANKARIEQLKFLAGDLKTTEGGAYKIDPSGGFTFTPRPGAEGGKEFIPGIGEIAMSPDDLIRLRAARETLSQNPNDSPALREFYRIVDKYRSTPPSRPGAQQAAPGAEGESQPPRKGPMTPSEAELQKEVEKSRALATAKGESERFEGLMNRASTAPGRIAVLESIASAVRGPNAKQYLGVFEGPKLSDALLKLSEGAGIKEIRDVFTNLGLDKNVKAEQLAIQQQIGLINLEMRKITRTPGEGAMSDFESRLALSAGLDRTDTPAGIAKKIEFLKAKERYELEFARALQKSGMTYNDFVLNSREYDRLNSQYAQTLIGIVGQEAAQKATATPSVRRPASDAGPRLRKELGIP